MSTAVSQATSAGDQRLAADTPRGHAGPPQPGPPSPWMTSPSHWRAGGGGRTNEAAGDLGANAQQRGEDLRAELQRALLTLKRLLERCLAADTDTAEVKTVLEGIAPFCPSPTDASTLANESKTGQDGAAAIVQPPRHEESLPSPEKPDAAPFPALPDDPRKRLAAVMRHFSALRGQARDLIQPAVGALLKEAPSLNADQKAALAFQINECLFNLGLAIRLPGTDSPGFLVADPVTEASPGNLRLKADTAEGELADPPDPIEIVPVEELSRREEPWAERIKGEKGPYAPLVPAEEVPREEMLTRLLPLLQERLRAMPHETYEDKKKLTAWLNSELGRFGLALKCPKTGRPSNLLAGSGGKQSRSRFVFQNRDDSGKEERPYSTRDIDTLLEHLELVPADPRKQRWGRWARHTSSEPRSGKS